VSLLVIHPRGRATVDQLARDAGLHPETVRRLLRLGLIAAPAIRLRRDLGLNLAGAVLACELLARIDDLEERLARSPSNGRHPR
jgi:hypothetical protein